MRAWGGEDPPGVVYFYAPGRAGENAETFLTGFDGALQIDGYQGYNRLTRPTRKGGTPIDADILLMLTDVTAVFRDWGGPDQAAIGCVTPDELDEMSFAEGSMGPKITSASAFVRAGGVMAGIGRLQDARKIVDGLAGTQVRMEPLCIENQMPDERNATGIPKDQPASARGAV